VADRGGRAAGGKAANHRVSWHDHAFGLGLMDRRFSAWLRELGWIEGRSVAIEYHWAESRGERFPEIAAEFARLKVDVIISAGVGVTAAKQATSVILIVFASARDPIGTGLVASLARPGGNITDFAFIEFSIVGNWLELLKEMAPDIRQGALIFNPRSIALLRHLTARTRRGPRTALRRVGGEP
jgi:putative ABC transport system substrate-binding protein